MKNGRKAVMGVLGALLVAMMFAIPTSTVTAVAGTWVKNTLFEDNFDDQSEVDWDKWATEGDETMFDIAYDSMEISYDVTANYDDYANWSYGIHTKYGYTNDTLYSTTDIFPTFYMQDGVIWTGFIDQEYVNATNMTQAYAGLVGAVFVNEGMDEFIGAWWVDSTNTYHQYELDVDYDYDTWFTVSIYYNQTAGEATVNVTDTVSGASDEKDITHIKDVEDDVKGFTYGYTEYNPTLFKEGNQINIHYVPVIYYMDNVEIWTYDFVAGVTPPPPTPTVDYAQLFGLWIAIFGGIMTVVSLAFYGDLTKYLKSHGYLNAKYIAMIPVAVGLGIIGIGGLVYYGYAGVITWHPQYAWW